MAPAALARGPEGASLGEQRGGCLWVGVPSRPAAARAGRPATVPPPARDLQPSLRQPGPQIAIPRRCRMGWPPELLLAGKGYFTYLYEVDLLICFCRSAAKPLAVWKRPWWVANTTGRVPLVPRGSS